MAETKATAGPFNLKGQPAAPGVAVGPPLVVSHRDLEIPSERIAPDRTVFQEKKSAEVLSRVESQLNELRDTQSDNEVRDLLEAQIEIIRDPELSGRIRQLIREEHRSADFALYTAFNEYIQLLRQSGQGWVRDRIVDLQSLRNRLIQQSGGLDAVPDQSEGAILFADELSTTEVIEYCEAGIAAIVMRHGGRTSHAVILSQALGIPCVIGVEWRRTQLDGVDRVAVDAMDGEVVIDPDSGTLGRFEELEHHQELQRSRELEIGELPNRTRCGVPFRLEANMEFEQELPQIQQVQAEGIGLLRTETLFLRQGYFDSERHAHFYRHILAETGENPLTIRLLDIGGDKLPGRDHQEANPFLGWRGIRILLDESELLKKQLTSIFEVAAEVPGRIRILLPMVSDLSELREIRARIDQLTDELEKSGKRGAAEVPVGIMIEVPAIALQADQVALEADFFSIGSNDLTQYVLAADRGNERVSDLYSPSHPAVWKLIDHSVKAAKKAGIPVSVCGEIAGNPILAGALIGMGIRELSMNPSSIPAVKKLLCRYELDSFQTLFRSLISASGRQESDQVLEEWTQRNREL